MESAGGTDRHLFVYGTLLSEIRHPMHEVLDRYATLVGKGVINGELYGLDGYPAAVPSTKESDVVKGEVYRLNDADTSLILLDRYESCEPGVFSPAEYRREEMPVRMADGATLAAWVYVYNLPVEGLERIPSGDYIEHQNNQ